VTSSFIIVLAFLGWLVSNIPSIA
jgi:hypothetical protein